MLSKVINVYKKCGQTPLECISELKQNDKELAILPMTYAGRLDPLAEGVLLILIGDECLKKEEYLNLGKVYEVEVLFGFATDTYDLMGKITKDNNTKDNSTKDNNSEVLKNILPKFIGKIKQPYPPYSSRPVNGKPLFQWAREGKLDEIEIPVHDVFVEKIEIIEEKEITGEKLHQKIKNDISKVKGDFRQEEILALWNDELKDKQEEKYPVIKLRITCGSGFYVRVLANDLGVETKIPSIALNIERISIGDYKTT